MDEMTIDIAAPKPFRMFPACLITIATIRPPMACDGCTVNGIIVILFVIIELPVIKSLAQLTRSSLGRNHYY